MKYAVELVGKIGSMALIDKESNILNYTLIARISQELKPGYVWVTSGAAETGRLDFIKRNGKEAEGSEEDLKTDYASQGQSILMETYRRFVDPAFSLRQVLVEHQHFNDEEKREHLKQMLLRAVSQNAIPIINYNDAVSTEESRKFEIRSLKNEKKKVVECVDNDETAAQIACLLKAKTLLILTSADGIYKDKDDPTTLIKEISGKDADELLFNITQTENYCDGASRKGANGARAKLEYVKEAAKLGTKVIIGSAKFKISDLLSGKAPATRIGIR